MLAPYKSLLQVVLVIGTVGLLFALAATLPLWVVFAITSPLAESFAVPEVFYLSVISPLAEEVVYRGFAFGQLRRLAGWSFLAGRSFRGLSRS